MVDICGCCVSASVASALAASDCVFAVPSAVLSTALSSAFPASDVSLTTSTPFRLEAALTREKIIAADGAANYIRPFLNALDEEEFDMFVQYHLSTCERADLMGASAHTVDILRV